MKRKSFIFAGSSNLKAAKEAHFEELKRNHEENATFLKSVADSITLPTQFIKHKHTEVCLFGKWVPMKPGMDYSGFKTR